MNTAAHYYLRGMGLGQSTATIASSIAQGAGTAVGTALLGPAGGAIGAAAGALAGGIADLFSGCGQTCTTASDYANTAQTLLQQNIQAYFDGQISQADALSNYNTIWGQLVSACNNPALGSAGQNCISQRQQGACYFAKAAPPQFPGQPATGTCWNFYNAFYLPIANDPGAAGVASSPLSSITSAITGDSTPWLIAAGIAGLVFLVLL
jgi:hypothetical protein